MFRLCSPEGLRALVKLAPRETQLILLACGGLTDKEIAKALSISTGTVITLWSTIRGKLGISSRAAAVAAISWAVAKMEGRHFPEFEDAYLGVASSVPQPAILVLGKFQVILMCNGLAASMFDVRPGLTFEKSPRLTRAGASDGDFPWMQSETTRGSVDEILQLSQGSGPAQPVMVNCTFADDPVFGRVAILRIYPTNDFPVSERPSSEPLEPSPGPVGVELRQEAVASWSKNVLEGQEAAKTFSAMFAADLNDPLQAIAGYSRILAEEHGDELSETGRDVLDRLRANTERVASIVEGILAYSTDGADRPRAVVDLPRLVADVVSEVGVPDRVDVDVDIDPITLEGDAAAISVCVGSLFRNAVRFATGAKQPKIAVTGRSDGIRCRIVFRDNGLGFDMEEGARPFQMFDRIIHRGVPGEGLGLALVSCAAASMGGFIVPESKPGKGTTFTLDLPHVTPSVDE